MKCVNCEAETYVIETREKLGVFVRRRRVCESCGIRFATYEFSDTVVQYVIKMLGGRRRAAAMLGEYLPQMRRKKATDDD